MKRQRKQFAAHSPQHLFYPKAFMNKILTTLIAGLFAAGAYAQTPAPAEPAMPAATTATAPAAMPAPAKAAKTAKAKSHHKKVAKKKAHKAAPKVA